MQFTARFQLQPADALKLANVVGDEDEATGDGLPRDEQVIRPDGCALTLQFRANVRGGFRARAVERQFNDGGNKLRDLLPFFCRV